MRVITSPTQSALYFLSSDHLGSSSLTTDASGNVVARQLYDAWGNVRSGGGLPTDIGYTGQRADSYIKLVQMGARWYDPYLNRWIQPDTIVPDPKNPQSLNRYSYANNNPLRYVDPSGHAACENDNPQSCSPEDYRNYLIQQIRIRATLYGIVFAGSGWDYTRMAAVVDAAVKIGSALLPAYQRAAADDLRTARRSANTGAARAEGLTAQDFRQLDDLDSLSAIFRAVYEGMTFNHTDQDNPDAWAQTDGHVVRLFNGAFDDTKINLFTWHFPAHELGHAFSQIAGRVPYNDLSAAGLGGLVTTGAWTQRREDTNNEYFADAFQGWVGDHLADNWNNWMNTNMSRWVALTVTGNQ